MKLRIFISLLFINLLAMSCSHSAPRRYYPNKMNPRLEYRYFSVARPIDSNWFMDADEQFWFQAKFKVSPLSRTHTFYAVATLIKASNLKRQEGDFSSVIAEELKFIRDHERYEVAEIKQSDFKRNGLDCISFYKKILDKKVPGFEGLILTMIDQGFYCKLPKTPEFIFYATYSERGLPEELDNRFLKEGKYFLENIQIY